MVVTAFDRTVGSTVSRRDGGSVASPITGGGSLILNSGIREAMCEAVVLTRAFVEVVRTTAPEKTLSDEWTQDDSP